MQKYLHNFVLQICIKDYKVKMIKVIETMIKRFFNAYEVLS